MGVGKIAEVGELLVLARTTAERAGRRLLEDVTGEYRGYIASADHPREIKAEADRILDQEIHSALASTGVPVLSEEAGLLSNGSSDTIRFIVDPVDGTFNYVHGLGPWAVSIALWRGLEPIFGVVYSGDDDEVFWGGPGIGAFRGECPIRVSSTLNRSRASVCTGVPSRVEIDDPGFRQRLLKVIGAFGKIRMIGSAAVSLVRVASGIADAYCEDGIMIWDVAGGLAIVEGAGGRTTLRASCVESSYDVFAGNGRFRHPSE